MHPVSVLSGVANHRMTTDFNIHRKPLQINLAAWKKTGQQSTLRVARRRAEKKKTPKGAFSDVVFALSHEGGRAIGERHRFSQCNQLYVSDCCCERKPWPKMVNLYVRCQHPNNPCRQTKSIGVCLLAALTTSFSEAINDIREYSREQRNRRNRRHRGGSSLVQ